MNYKEIKFKMLPDNELLAFWDLLRDEAKQLRTNISEYTEGKRSVRRDDIKSEYSRQKDRIRYMWNYLDKLQNRKGVSEHYSSFRIDVMEAAAHGYLIRKGHQVDSYLYGAVSEAYYRLGKSYPSIT